MHGSRPWVGFDQSHGPVSLVKKPPFSPRTQISEKPEEHTVVVVFHRGSKNESVVGFKRPVYSTGLLQDESENKESNNTHTLYTNIQTRAHTHTHAHTQTLWTVVDKRYSIYVFHNARARDDDEVRDLPEVNVLLPMVLQTKHATPTGVRSAAVLHCTKPDSHGQTARRQRLTG